MILSRSVGGVFRPVDIARGGTGSYISWERLFEQQLRDAGEIRSNETVTQLQIDENGIHYTVETN